MLIIIYLILSAYRALKIVKPWIMLKPTDNDVLCHLANSNAKVQSLTKVQVLVLKMTRHSQSVYWPFQDCKGSSPSRRGCAKLTTLCGYEPHWIGAVQ